jgi:hypothetical protein
VKKQNTEAGGGKNGQGRQYLYMSPTGMIIFKLNKLIQSFFFFFFFFFFFGTNSS